MVSLGVVSGACDRLLRTGHGLCLRLLARSHERWAQPELLQLAALQRPQRALDDAVLVGRRGGPRGHGRTQPVPDAPAPRVEVAELLRLARLRKGAAPAARDGQFSRRSVGRGGRQRRRRRFDGGGLRVVCLPGRGSGHDQSVSRRGAATRPKARAQIHGHAGWRCRLSDAKGSGEPSHRRCSVHRRGLKEPLLVRDPAK